MDGGAGAGSKTVPTLETLNATLERALLKRRFVTVSHVANVFMRNSAVVQASDRTYALFAECYGAMADQCSSAGDTDLAGEYARRSHKFRLRAASACGPSAGPLTAGLPFAAKVDPGVPVDSGPGVAVGGAQITSVGSNVGGGAAASGVAAFNAAAAAAAAKAEAAAGDAVEGSIPEGLATAPASVVNKMEAVDVDRAAAAGRDADRGAAVLAPAGGEPALKRVKLVTAVEADAATPTCAANAQAVKPTAAPAAARAASSAGVDARLAEPPPPSPAVAAPDAAGQESPGPAGSVEVLTGKEQVATAAPGDDAQVDVARLVDVEANPGPAKCATEPARPGPADAATAPFFVDRRADRTLWSADSAVPRAAAATGAEAAPGRTDAHADHVQLLDELIDDAHSVAKRPGHAHFAAVAELTTQGASRPRYEDAGSGTVDCVVRLRVVRDLRQAGVSDGEVRCRGRAGVFRDARQIAAGQVVAELERRANLLRIAAVKRFDGVLQRLIKDVWRLDLVQNSRVDAFKRAQAIILYDVYGGKVRPFGSFSAGLAQKESDIDVEVVLPKPDARMAEIREFSCLANRVLLYLSHRFAAARMSQVTVVRNARVPVLKYFDVDHQVRVDVTIATSTKSVLLTRLIRRHMLEDARTWEVAMLVKHWSHRRLISKTVDHYICSVAWTTMVIYFLRSRTPAVGAFLRVENRDSSHDARDVRFRRVPWDVNGKNGTNGETAVQLVGEFFNFYQSFDFARIAVELRRQRTVRRSELAPGHRAAHVYIENPVDPGANMAAAVEGRCLDHTLAELRRASHISLNTGDVEKLCEPPPRDRHACYE
jgi:hypothetical protein